MQSRKKLFINNQMPKLKLLLINAIRKENKMHSKMNLLIIIKTFEKNNINQQFVLNKINPKHLKRRVNRFPLIYRLK